MIKNLLIDHIKNNVPDSKVAVLLSGGVDSISVGLAAHHAGKEVHAYSFQLGNQTSYDFAKAAEVSYKMKWEFTPVVVPKENLKKLIQNFFGAFDTNADLGLLAEYMRDSRLNKSTDALQHDVFFGLRLALNDESDTQALAGLVQDLHESTRQFFVEASRRISDSMRASLELQIFSSIERGDILSDLREDDFLGVEFAYYY